MGVQNEGGAIRGSSMTNLAPIVLFVYNRPAHTRQTIEALQRNEHAQESDLFIFSDAPKNPAAAEAVSVVREYIRTITGFKSIRIVERDKNWGLANSIIDGVTTVVNKYGRIIVLEDDLITSPYFLSYMNMALETYKDDEKVMHISGYMFPVNATRLPETFFLRPTTCWGWATWDRAWKHFSKEPRKLLDEYSEQTIYRFNMDGSYNYWEQVKQNDIGVINTWAVFWYASVFQMDGLCLHPAVSMTNNIGHDGTGEHCKEGDAFYSTLASKPITFYENNIVESLQARNITKRYLRKLRPHLFHRISAAIKRRLNR